VVWVRCKEILVGVEPSNPRGVTFCRGGKCICCFFLNALPCCVSLCAAVGPRPVVRIYQRAVYQGPDGDCGRHPRFDMTLQQSTGKDHAAWDWQYHALPHPEARQPGFSREPDAPPCCIEHLVMWSPVGIS
jgi:hypothetical protein